MAPPATPACQDAHRWPRRGRATCGHWPLSWEPIARYIQDQYHYYNKEESAPQRKRYIRDSRIHVCLYFVAPTDRG